ARGRLMTAQGLRYREYAAKFPHTIGFPSLVLAPAFRAFGVRVSVALAVNLALSLGSVALVYGIARRVHGRLMGLFAMGLAAVWPSHVLYASMVASEPVFTLLILAALYALSHVLILGEDSFRWRHPVAAVALLPAAGIVLGIANGIRPMALILAIAVCLALLWQNERLPLELGAARQILSRGWLCALIVFLCYSLTSTVLTSRVYAIVRMEPAQGLTASGFNFMIGTNVRNKGVWNAEDAAFFDGVYEATGSAQQAHRESLDVALERIRSAPEDTLDLFVYKFRDLWQTDDFGIDWNLLWAEQQGKLTEGLKAWLESLRPVSRELYLLVLAWALAAAIHQWRKRARLDPIFLIGMLFFLGTAALHMLLETQVRYHYNMIPFLILLAMYAPAAWRGELGETAPAAPKVEKAPRKELPPPAQPKPGVDLGKAIREGHIRITLTEESARVALEQPEKEGPGEEGRDEA
ncbi:MAG TPA: glycosyltransferase family 39 protein, partial [Clostridia bacterium]|nr:glycosyltransferase family 39 protein [Clostridia bacterium]